MWDTADMMISGSWIYDIQPGVSAAFGTPRMSALTVVSLEAFIPSRTMKLAERRGLK